MKPINPTLATVDDLADFDTLIDVRSPAEFAEDHIPGAVNFPVLSDEERARVGWLYKQESPFAARKVGAALISRNIARHIEADFITRPKSWRPMVYCWRGGQRSGSLLHILREIGWPARRLEGGYKVWRHHVLDYLESGPDAFRYRVIAGPTGSAKSKLLEALAAKGEQILHLEALAAHKGSVLGDLPSQAQPSQKFFETGIYHALHAFDPARPVYVEAESRVVGRLRLPQKIFDAICASECFRVEASLEARVAFLLTDYAYLCDAASLNTQLERLVAIRGKEIVAGWQAMASAGDYRQLTEALLVAHYDPLYRRSQRPADGPGMSSLQAGDLSPGDIERLADELIAR